MTKLEPAYGVLHIELIDTYILRAPYSVLNRVKLSRKRSRRALAGTEFFFMAEYADGMLQVSPTAEPRAGSIPFGQGLVHMG